MINKTCSACLHLHPEEKYNYAKCSIIKNMVGVSIEASGEYYTDDDYIQIYEPTEFGCIYWEELK